MTNKLLLCLGGELGAEVRSIEEGDRGELLHDIPGLVRVTRIIYERECALLVSTYEGTLAVFDSMSYRCHWESRRKNRKDTE